MLKSAMEPYFSEAIESRISLARNGDLIATYNLLAYFCSCVQRGAFPPLILSSYVAEILEKDISDIKRKNLYRSKKIHEEMNQLKSLPRRNGIIFRSMRIGAEKACSISKAAYLEKYPPNTCVIDFCDAARKNVLNEKMLKDVFPVIQQMIKGILNPAGIGKAKRHKLDLHGFGQWNSADELHKEILQDVEHYGLSKTSKNHDMKVDTIKKIRKRKNK